VLVVPNEDGVEKVDVPNRGNGVDVDDEVAVPNREELVFDVEEEIKCGTARRKGCAHSQSKIKDLMQVN
jgi:hypothetical protein